MLVANAMLTAFFFFRYERDPETETIIEVRDLVREFKGHRV